MVFMKARPVEDDSGPITALASRKDIQTLRLFVTLAKAQHYSEEEQVSTFGNPLGITSWYNIMCYTDPTIDTQTWCRVAIEPDCDISVAMLAPAIQVLSKGTMAKVMPPDGLC